MTFAPLVCLLLGLSPKVALPPGALVRYGDPFAVPASSWVTLSPDGRYVVVSPSGLAIDTRTGRRFVVPCDEDESVVGCQVVADGKMIVWGQPHLRVFDIATGQRLRWLDVPKRLAETPCWISASADARHVACLWGTGGNPNLQLTVHDLDGGPIEGILLNAQQSYSFAVSPDGESVSYANAPTGQVVTVSSRTGKQTGSATIPNTVGNAVYPLVYSPDGQTIFAGLQGRYFRISPDRGTVLESGQHDIVNAMSATASGARIVAISATNDVVSLDATTLKLLERKNVSTYLGRPAGLPKFLSADGSTLVTLDTAGPFQIWDLAAKRLQFEVPVRWPVGSIGVGSGEVAIAIYGSDGAQILRYDERDGRLRSASKSDYWAFHAEFISRDSHFVDMTSVPGRTVIRETATRKSAWDLGQIPNGQPWGNIVRGSRVILCAADTINVYDLAAKRGVFSFKDLAGCKHVSMILTPDGRSLLASRELGATTNAVTEKTGTIAVIELATGTLRREIVPTIRGISLYFLGIDHSGRYAALTANPGAFVLDLHSGQTVFSDSAPSATAFSADGRWFVLSSNELVDLKAPGMPRIKLPIAVPIAAAAFAPDCKRLATGFHDGTALLWDMAALERQFPSTPPSAPPAPMTAEKLWELLGSPDAAKAEPAIQKLTANPADALRLVRANLKPAGPIDANAVARSVGQLDSPQFPIRQAAHRELAEYAERAAPILRATVRETPSVELRQRAEDLLAQLEGRVKSPARLKAIRGVELLERLGTPEAKTALRRLAGGAADADLTADAKAALTRLDR